jgi:hypothetical protein
MAGPSFTLCRPLFLLLYEITRLTWLMWTMTDEGICYLNMILHILMAMILIQVDARPDGTYKRKSRWRKKINNVIGGGLRKITNNAGELLHKMTIILPNYKTRHKSRRRKIRPSIFDKEKRRRAKIKSVSAKLKIMSRTLQEYETPTKAYATNISTQKRNNTIHTDFHASSYEIYVDNCASRSITNNLSDFIDTPVPADVRIYGTNGVSTGTLMPYAPPR